MSQVEHFNAVFEMNLRTIFLLHEKKNAQEKSSAAN